METEVRFAVSRGKDGHPEFAVPDPGIYFLEQLVARLHTLAVQERAELHPDKFVVDQTRDILLGVDSSMIYENVAWSSRIEELSLLADNVAT